MVVVVFITKLRADADLEEYGRLAERMFELVQQNPGFISLTSSTDPDGSEVTIARFASEEAEQAWRNHPEHRKIQELGRSTFYESYQIEVCTAVRGYSFHQEGGITHQVL